MNVYIEDATEAVSKYIGGWSPESAVELDSSWPGSPGCSTAGGGRPGTPSGRRLSPATLGPRASGGDRGHGRGDERIRRRGSCHPPGGARREMERIETRVRTRNLGCGQPLTARCSEPQSQLRREDRGPARAAGAADRHSDYGAVSHGGAGRRGRPADPDLIAAGMVWHSAGAGRVRLSRPGRWPCIAARAVRPRPAGWPTSP